MPDLLGEDPVASQYLLFYPVMPGKGVLQFLVMSEMYRLVCMLPLGCFAERVVSF